MGRLVKTDEGYKLKTSAQEYDISIIKILITLLAIVIMLLIYDAIAIDIYAESTEASKIEYRVRRTIDQEAGVICWTAFTEHDLSMDCMLLKNTYLDIGAE